MIKVMLVFGTRPEAIKMCPLVKEFQKHNDAFETIVCVTGQHREMLDQVLNIFEVKPDYDLNIMKQGQDLYDVTARVLTGMRDVFKECRFMVIPQHQRRQPLQHSISRFLLVMSRQDFVHITSTHHGQRR